MGFMPMLFFGQFNIPFAPGKPAEYLTVLGVPIPTKKNAEPSEEVCALVFVDPLWLYLTLCDPGWLYLTLCDHVWPTLRPLLTRPPTHVSDPLSGGAPGARRVRGPHPRPLRGACLGVQPEP